MTSASRRLLVVSGAGRSGTSSVSGALKLLGAHIPQPEVPANQSNPRGHFEPQWVVDFHNDVLSRAGVHPVDARPETPSLVTEALTKADGHTDLTAWATDHLPGELNVVKDPRTVWFHDAWAEVARALGVSTLYLTMLRHPAEVVGSRDLHYNKSADAELRLQRETASLAGWVNVMLANEEQTRGLTRTFVPYDDLLSNWRSAFARVATDLGLDFGTDLAEGSAHPIDEFIDPGLRRSTLAMDDLDVPVPLREIAEGVWDNLVALVADPTDASAGASNDELRVRYDTLYRHSTALVMHHTKATAKASAAKARRVAAKQADRRRPARRVRAALRRVTDS